MQINYPAKAVSSNKKGQVALEATFLVLFIAVAIFVVVARIQTYSYEAEVMSITRARAQAIAAELSMEGTITHLVRVDAENLSNNEVTVWIVSEECDSVIYDKFINALPNYNITLTNNECSEKLYWDTKH